MYLFGNDNYSEILRENLDDKCLDFTEVISRTAWRQYNGQEEKW